MPQQKLEISDLQVGMITNTKDSSGVGFSKVK